MLEGVEIDGSFRTPYTQARVAGAFDNLAPLPAAVICGRAEDISPEDVAAWLWTRLREVPSSTPLSKFREPWRPRTETSHGGSEYGEADPAPALDALQPLPASVLCGRAEDVEVPPGDLGRVLCFLDPPYSGTTGYAHLFPREAVVAVARRWAEAGAHVVISEAEPLPELIEDGWHFTDIADARIGQRRTFSKQQREVLTSNRPLRARHAWPARDALHGQFSLFGQP
jgi:hypothetical protein